MHPSSRPARCSLLSARAARENSCKTKKPREVAKKEGIHKIGEHTGLLWKLSDTQGAGETYLDETSKVRSKQNARAEGLVGSIGGVCS